jgi:cytochrome b pre-mRNA-processing protein 3
MLVLHGGMVVRRLQQAEAPGPQIAQDLIDRIFYGLDADLRELGVGDTVVPKRMKKLAEAFLGRSAAYQAALAEPIDGDHAGTALEIAIARNVYDGAAAGPRLVAYVRTLHQALAAASLDVCLAAPLPFPEIEVP